MPTLLLRLVGPCNRGGLPVALTNVIPGRSRASPVSSDSRRCLGDRPGELDRTGTAHTPVYGVRHDRPGVPKCDYQTAEPTYHLSGPLQAIHETAVTTRHYLADAAFLVGLEGQDRPFWNRLTLPCAIPSGPLALGRKSYVPSEPIWMENGLAGCSVAGSLGTVALDRLAAEMGRLPREALGLV